METWETYMDELDLVPSWVRWDLGKEYVVGQDLHHPNTKYNMQCHECGGFSFSL